MKAIVLGLDHTIQYQDDAGRFKAVIRELCDKHGFDLIAEEWSTSYLKHVWTVGREAAVRNRLRR